MVPRPHSVGFHFPGFPISHFYFKYFLVSPLNILCSYIFAKLSVLFPPWIPAASNSNLEQNRSCTTIISRRRDQMEYSVILHTPCCSRSGRFSRSQPCQSTVQNLELCCITSCSARVSWQKRQSDGTDRHTCYSHTLCMPL